MALRGLKMGLVMVLTTAVWATVSAQTSCTSTIVSLYPCLGYVTGNTSTPSQSCCSQLSSVVNSQPQCLCMLLNGGGSSFGVNLNKTQALTLPGACKVQTPPVSRCNDAVSPPASPAGTPVTPSTPSKPTEPTASAPTTKPSTPPISGTPPSTPSTTPATAISGGSKAVPSTGEASSAASSTTAKSLSLVLSVLLIGSCASSALAGF